MEILLQIFSVAISYVFVFPLFNPFISYKIRYPLRSHAGALKSFTKKKLIGKLIVLLVEWL